MSYLIGIPLDKTDDDFPLIAFLFMIPVAMIIFLLIAEGRLIVISHQKDQQLERQKKMGISTKEHRLGTAK